LLKPYKIFTDVNQYSQDRRPFLADLLRPFINLRNYEQNHSIYGKVVDRFQLIDELEQADCAVLPLAWNFYHSSGCIPLATKFIEVAQQAKKPVLTWVTGDFGARVPVAGVWIFGPSGYRSRAGSRRFGTPIFISDPLLELNEREIHLREKGSRPRLGFCGYAGISIAKSAGFALRTLMRNTASHLHLTGDEAQEVYPAVLLRRQILEQLSLSQNVETDFIQRTKYKADAHTREARQQTRLEYLKNILNTDYTVCVRGGGNFSVRLYDTLAMGRFPILVDTDCLLPYGNDPHWHTCCVYVERHEIPYIGEKVADFHAKLNGDDFFELQYEARKFWQERLSFNGFFTHFPEHISI
jgi:hypothetical protein